MGAQKQCKILRHKLLEQRHSSSAALNEQRCSSSAVLTKLLEPMSKIKGLNVGGGYEWGKSLSWRLAVMQEAEAEMGAKELNLQLCPRAGDGAVLHSPDTQRAPKLLPSLQGGSQDRGCVASSSLQPPDPLDFCVCLWVRDGGPSEALGALLPCRQ